MVGRGRERREFLPVVPSLQTTTLSCMKPGYSTSISKGEAETLNFRIFHSLSRAAYRGEEEELVVYMYLVALYYFR